MCCIVGLNLLIFFVWCSMKVVELILWLLILFVWCMCVWMKISFFWLCWNGLLKNGFCYLERCVCWFFVNMFMWWVIVLVVLLNIGRCFVSIFVYRVVLFGIGWISCWLNMMKMVICGWFMVVILVICWMIVSFVWMVWFLLIVCCI